MLGDSFNYLNINLILNINDIYIYIKEFECYTYQKHSATVKSLTKMATCKTGQFSYFDSHFGHGWRTHLYIQPVDFLLPSFWNKRSLKFTIKIFRPNFGDSLKCTIISLLSLHPCLIMNEIMIYLPKIETLQYLQCYERIKIPGQFYQ